MQTLYKVLNIRDPRLVSTYNRWIGEGREIQIDFDTDLVEDNKLCAITEQLNEIVYDRTNLELGGQRGLDSLFIFVDEGRKHTKTITNPDCPTVVEFGKDCIIDYIELWEDTADPIGKFYICITNPKNINWEQYAKSLEDIISRMAFPYSTQILIDHLMLDAKRKAREEDNNNDNKNGLCQVW